MSCCLKGGMREPIFFALLSMILILVAGPGHAVPWPGSNWSSISPAEAGVDDAGLAQAVDYGRRGDSAGMIVLGGRVVAQWGNVKQRYQIRSATKSIGSIVLGLAIDGGRTSLGTYAHTILSEIATPPSSNTSKGWHREITIEQLATHTAGFDKAGGFTALLFRPGTAYAYSDGGANWLADTMTVLFDKDLRTLMRERVFRVIGIADGDLGWRDNGYRPKTLRGKPRREFGSGITTGADALARIGLLMARDGLWNNQRILSADYVHKTRSTRPLLSGLKLTDSARFGGATRHYGLLWWNNADGRLAGVPRDAFWAWGLGENLIIAVPSLDLVISRAASTGLQSGWQPDYDIIQPLLGKVVAALPQAGKLQTAEPAVEPDPEPAPQPAPQPALATKLTVNAGPDVSAELRREFPLAGRTSPGASASWKVIEAEGGKRWAVKIPDPTKPAQMIKVIRTGRYVVELSATDGSSTVRDRAVLRIKN